MSQVFISYSRRDLAFVERLAKDISSAGFDVWYDVSSLEVGTNWGKEIQAALSKSQTLIVVLTPHSLESRWVEREYIYAENHHLKIIPILYKPCELPLWTLDLQHIDLTTGNYKKCLGELLRVLGKPEKIISRLRSEPKKEPARIDEIPPFQTIPDPGLKLQNGESAEIRPDIFLPVEDSGEQKIPVHLEQAGRSIIAKRNVKPRWWMISTAIVIVISIAGVLLGQRLGLFSLIPVAIQRSTATSSVTIMKSPIPVDPTPLPTMKAFIDFSPPNSEQAKNFADPIRSWVSAFAPSLDVDFSTTPNYGNLVMYVDGKGLSIGQQVLDGAFKLHSDNLSELWIHFKDAYYTEPENQVMPNSFVLQFDLWTNPSDSVQADIGITGSDRHLWSSFLKSGGLNVRLADSNTGNVIFDLGSNEKVVITSGEWHTIQVISTNHNLAIYLDQAPVFFRESADDREFVGIEMKIQLDPGSEVSLDNIKLWDLSFMPKNLEPNPGTYWTTTFISPMDEMEMVYIPEGSFLMGSDVAVTQKQPFNYFPAHEVKLSAYWIDSHEVTNWQYLQCVLKGNCIAPKSTSSLTHENYFDNQEYDDSPVVNVTWDMAKTYCEWAGRRLPTEAEWENAAHGIEKWVYPWGNDPFTTDYGNFKSEINDTTRVGGYELGRSYYGLYDMAGNVWEWVQDYFIDDYYSKSPKSDPPGPDKENSFGQRIIRGGCFKDDQATVNTYVRMPVGIDWYEWSTGFRCATSTIQN